MISEYGESKAVWLIRHAHRQPARAGSYGNEIALTEEGLKSAFSLGKQFSFIEEIHSSPLLRCLQTAQEILKGTGGQRKTIFTSSYLGDPGPFIKDTQSSGPLFLERSIEEIAFSVVSGETLPGMYPLKEGAKRLMSYLKSAKQSPCFMISHDIVICLLCCFLFDSKDVAYYMPHFLEGIKIDFALRSISCRAQERVMTASEWSCLYSF
jgi:broad specificity phosphatase PhoE